MLRGKLVALAEHSITGNVAHLLRPDLENVISLFKHSENLSIKYAVSIASRYIESTPQSRAASLQQKSRRPGVPYLFILAYVLLERGSRAFHIALEIACHKLPFTRRHGYSG